MRVGAGISIATIYSLYKETWGHEKEIWQHTSYEKRDPSQNAVSYGVYFEQHTASDMHFGCGSAVFLHGRRYRP